MPFRETENRQYLKGNRGLWSRLPARSVFNVSHWQTTPPATTTFYKQYFYRGKLDEQTAKKMKRLAKNKRNLTIKEATYEQGNYIKEMEQDVLLKEATAKSEFDGGFYEDK